MEPRLRAEEVVISQLEEMLDDGCIFNFTERGITEAIQLCFFVFCYSDSVEPSVSQGQKDCIHLLFHNFETSKSLEIELSPDGNKYQRVVYQDRSSFQQFAAMGADPEQLFPLMERIAGFDDDLATAETEPEPVTGSDELLAEYDRLQLSRSQGAGSCAAA